MNYLPLLKQFPAFGSVPDEQLQWLADRVSEETWPAETILHNAGDPVDYLMLLVDGHIRVENGGDEIIDYEPISILGVLPFSRMKTATNLTITTAAIRVLLLHRDQFRALTTQCYELTEALVQQMTIRVRDFTRLIQQEDKLASLGRLSAGLAHELNNPVAAIVRSADTLRQHMQATPAHFKAVMTVRLPDDLVEIVNRLLFEKLGQNPAALSFLERSRYEDELTDWLDDHQVPDSCDLTEPLLDFGFTSDDLDELRTHVGADALPAVLGWIVNNLIAEKLVVEIADASGRISALVGSIKSYTHMDRGAGKETVHLGEGIRSTLTLLNHKLREKNLTVTVTIPDDLPTICGWPGELNQVWTNLIDNAVDALPDGGRLDISSERDREFVLTKVIDNGSGISEEIITNIFDPFFTTKGIGKGTGLGLDIVQGIIKHHNGSVKVKSEPGHTEFSICLPTS